MRATHASLFAVACLLVLNVSGAAEGTKAPFKVIGIASYTGPAMNALGPVGRGFEAFIDYTNRNGGVDGRRIDLEVIDDQSSTNVGAALTQGAIAASPLALVHFGLSTILTQAKGIVENAPIAILTGSADDSLIYPKPMRNLFMINASAKQQAEALVRQAGQLIGAVKGMKFALALHQTAYNDSIVAAIKQMAQSEGYEVIAVERFNLGIPSFSSQGARVARVKPDAVLVAAVPGDAPIVVGAISDAGVSSVPIVGYAAMASSEVFRKLHLPNFFAYRPYNVGSEVENLAPKVGEAYKASMGSSLWTLGWAAGEVLVDALGKCGGDCTGEKLIEILERGGPVNSANDVLYGPVIFSKESHAGLTTVQPYKLEGERVVPAGDLLSIAK